MLSRLSPSNPPVVTRLTTRSSEQSKVTRKKMKLLTVLLGWTLLYTAQAKLRESTELDISVSSNRNYFGNDVKTRSSDLGAGGELKTWINYGCSNPQVTKLVTESPDDKANLQRGLLKDIYFYINANAQSREIVTRLQVWRPNGEETALRLVWEKKIAFNMSNSDGTLLQYELDEEFQTEANDKLGLTYERLPGLVSLDYTEECRTFFRNALKENGSLDYPAVGKEYKFDSIAIPIQMSLAARVTPLRCNAGMWGQSCQNTCGGSRCLDCNEDSGCTNCRPGLSGNRCQNVSGGPPDGSGATSVMLSTSFAASVLLAVLTQMVL